MVQIREISVHLLLPEYREEVDLETKWFEKVPKAIMDSYNFHSSKTKKRL